LDKRVKVLEELEEAFLAIRVRTIETQPGATCASVEEIREEIMAFFSEVLHCYAIIFAILRRTRTIYTVAQIAELQVTINRLKSLWLTQRHWEQKEASVTPKCHNLWFEVISQLAYYLGRFFHFMEDPIKKLHKHDKLTDAVYCNIRNYQFREECKQKNEAIARHVAVCEQWKLTPVTVVKRAIKAVRAIAVKKERRS
jgi:hypothetical protein